MSNAAEGELCLLEMLVVIRCVLLCMLEAVKGTLCLWRFSRCTRCTRCWRRYACLTLYAGGCGGRTLFAGGDTLHAEAVESGLSFGIAKFPWWQFSRYNPLSQWRGHPIT